MSEKEERRPWLEIPVPDYIPLEEKPEKQLNPCEWQDPDQEDERVIIIQL